MRLLPVLAPLVLAGFPLFAQTSVITARNGAADTQKVIALQRFDGSGCPVGFEAQHGQSGAVVNVTPAKNPPEQSYRITLLPRNERGIVQARVVLHGISGHQVLPAGNAERPDADSSESFTLSPASDAHHVFRSTIYVERLTGVQWVELKELTYADGSRWHESAAGSCRVTPNGYMLVAAEQDK